MSSVTAQTQAQQAGNSKEQEEMDEDEMGTTDADTSSWESEPHTARSSRKYHPVKGEHTAVVSEDEDDDQEPLTNGGIPENHAFGDQELLSSQYLRKTFGLERSGKQDGQQGKKEGEKSGQTQEKPKDTGVRNGFQRDGQTSDDAGQDRSESENDDSLDQHQQDTEDIIEEIDLTKEPKPSMFGRGAPGMAQAKFVFMPSLGPFGSSPFGSLMTGLLSSDGDGFENDADVSSQSEAEEARLPRAKPQISPGLDRRGQQERWEHLFGMLEQQHRQQVILQREHHERQVQLLQAQLASLTQEQEDLITKQHQEPLGYGTKSAPDEASSEQGKHPEEARKQARRSPNGKDKNALSPSLTPSESSQQDTYSSSGDSEVTLEGSLADASETLMTTWSDVVEQKQAEKEITGQEEQSRVEMPERNLQEPQMLKSRGEDDRFLILQTHFAQQQRQLQEQYALQVKHMQRQWAELQTQQGQQQEVLRHLLSRQQERITQTHRDIQGVTQGNEGQEPGEEADSMDAERSTPTSDNTSTTYSDFTYWKQAEEDTYRALPDVSMEDAARGQEGHQPEMSAAVRSPNPNGQGSPDLAVQWPAAGSGQRSPHVSGQSSSPRRSGDDGNAGEDAQLTSSLRLNLREKHARHIADLKAYYDSEIQELQNKLTEAASLRDHSPDKVTRRTNQRLQDNCVRLEAALKSANSRIEDLENTVKALESRLGETYTSTDSSVANLEQKVNDLKQLCRHKELDMQSLEKRNRELQVSLDQAYQLQDVQAMDEHRDQKILKKVLNEYKALAEKHEVTKELLHDMETQLYESKAKIADLSRTLSHLEFEVKRMDLESSVVKRQSLPKSLSGTSLRSRTSPNTTSATVPAAVTSPDDRRSQDKNHTSGIAKDTNNLPDTSAANRSVEDRKFLRPSADYNILTGEKLVSESGSESLQFTSDTESLTQSEDNRANLSAPGRHSDLGVPFDTDMDEERPLSPMMKAARQMDIWKAEESMNAGDNQGLLRNGLNGMHVTEKPDDRAHRSTEHRHNQSANNSSQSYLVDTQSPRGRLDGGPLSQDSSIHIWPASDKGTQRSAVPPAPASQLGAALAHSSPKQLARQSLAKAIKPKDHDIFPVRGAKESPPETSKRGSPAAARQSFEKAPSSVRPRKSKESPRRQLFGDGKRSDNRRLVKGENIADFVLAKVRAGDVQTRADWEGLGSSSSQRSQTPKKQTETSLDIVQCLNDHQKKLDQLMMEKRQLETTLSHVPISGRVSRQTRQDEERLEQRLEHVTRELGSVRMLLRKYNALKSSI
ncbi:myosin-9-like [Patiria miniata]|uniref:M-phase phosphoprotein 9 n=1 Tax=Patiria miniata TaxID=46514 RepID=A0A914BEX2_PATMI|nr:myosin-9-like [Patiria miniata]